MPNSILHRPTAANINLDNLAFNFHSVRQFIGEGIKVMAVVKANAYGHGAVECARRLEAEGAHWLGVALPEEAVELRNAGLRLPVLCLDGFWEGQESLLLKYNITPVIYRIEQAAALNKAAKTAGLTANIHIKIDTGMGRIGVRFDQIIEFAQRLSEFSNLKLEGLMTHFAAADDLSENDFTNKQIERFNSSALIFANKGFQAEYIDLANSPATVAHPEARGNMVRLGGVLYGLGGDVLPKGIETPQLKRVLSLSSVITHLKKVPADESLGYGRTFTTSRESLIATVPIGYEDGLPRSLSNRGSVIVKGHIAPIVGRISMDWTIIDVTDIPDVSINDEVILIGSQDGSSILAEDIAGQAGTISYEITCGISNRVQRRYI